MTAPGIELVDKLPLLGNVHVVLPLFSLLVPLSQVDGNAINKTIRPIFSNEPECLSILRTRIIEVYEMRFSPP